MAEAAFAYTTAHRDQLGSAAGRAEVRSWLRDAFMGLGTFTGRVRRFHVIRANEHDPNDLLTDELREYGYVMVGAVADVTRTT